MVMSAKAHIKEEEIVRCLRDAYGLNVAKISFLSLGADLNTTVYRVTTSSKADYFLNNTRVTIVANSILIYLSLTISLIK